MKRRLFVFAIIGGLMCFLPIKQADSIDSTLFWMKVKAKDKFERSVIANTGVSIEAIREDFVVAVGGIAEKKKLQSLGLLESEFTLLQKLDFPKEDAAYHNYTELTSRLQDLAKTYPQTSRLFSIGKSIEGRDLWAVEISGNLKEANTLPAIVFMGGHHAREHLSVELPIHYIEYLLEEYSKNNSRIVNLVNSRDIFIIPAVNPDGLEYDIKDGNYKMWRKNRRLNQDGVYGVDLNRNYGYKWGTGGSSTNTDSEVYMGTAPFSEPETQAIKAFVEKQTNISILLSFHTFSELILYPWGHSYEGIQNTRDKQVHEKMAQTMSQWNDYTPQQSSELYIASGDTTDWSYGAQKIISFTFELDPVNRGFGGGGFYPGAKIIPEVVQKNLEPVLYLIESADIPYPVLDGRV